MAKLLLRIVCHYGKLRVMTLTQYLRDQGITASQFAADLGVVPSTVTRWLKGERIPEDDLKVRIFEATAGKVTPGDFLGTNAA